MSRLFTVLFALVSLCSLLSLGALTAAWAYSYAAYDRGHILLRGQLFSFASAAGEIGLSWNSNDNPPEPIWFRRMSLSESGLSSTGIARTLEHNAAGFGFSQGSISLHRGGAPVLSRRVAFPYWFAAAVLGILPLAWAWYESRRHLYRKRAAQQLCRKCAFDISSIVGFCPECGEPTPPRAPVDPAQAQDANGPFRAPNRRAA